MELTVELMDAFYGDFHVPWDVSFEVRQGEIVVPVGANGAGKSTTLKTISSLVQAVNGFITFEGNKLHEIPGHKIIDLGSAHVPEARRPQLQRCRLFL